MSKGMKIPGLVLPLGLFLLFLAFSNQGFSQNRSFRSDKGMQSSMKEQDQPKSRKVKRAEEKAAAKKEKEQRNYEKAKEQDMKHRMDLQSPETKKRMKENKKKADENNDRYHRSFWDKIFGRKK